jgi:hypothetical protein
MVGTPSARESEFQTYGRAARDPSMQGLCLMLAEKWAFEPSKKPEQKELRTAPAVIQYVQATTCRRQLSARYMEDDTEHGELMHSLIFARLTPQLALDCVNGLCCDNHDGAEPGKSRLDFTEFFSGAYAHAESQGKDSEGLGRASTTEEALCSNAPDVAASSPRGQSAHVPQNSRDAIGAAPDGVFDTRFADDITSVINRFEFDAKLHEKQWRAMHEEKVAAKKAANAAKKAAKQRRAFGKADDLAHDDDNSEEGTEDEEEEQEEDEDEDDENVDDLGPSHVEEVEGERPAKQARLTIRLPARSAAQ